MDFFFFIYFFHFFFFFFGFGERIEKGIGNLSLHKSTARRGMGDEIDRNDEGNLRLMVGDFQIFKKIEINRKFTDVLPKMKAF